MNKTALITGGTRGIGLAISKALAAIGYNLVVNGVRDEKAVQPVLAQLQKTGRKVVYAHGDISKSDDRKRIIALSKSSFGQLNLLVNNAGIAPPNRVDVLNVPEHDYDRVMDINLKGTFFLSQEIAKWMIDQRNDQPDEDLAIINMTSISATVASANRAAYCISKAGLSMFTKVLAIQLAEHNIPVYEVQPGIIETDMTAKAKEQYAQQIKDGLTLEKRLGQPEDIAKAVLALAERQLPYSSGQTFVIDGGLTIQRL